MNVPAYRSALFVLILVSATARAEVHKCRQGERVIYQSQPCPAGSLALDPPETLPEPGAYEVNEARTRARNDISAAEALRHREEKTAKTREKAHASALRQETDCTRLLGKIGKAEAGTESGKSRKKTLKSDQRKYRKECGPL